MSTLANWVLILRRAISQNNIIHLQIKKWNHSGVGLSLLILIFKVIVLVSADGPNCMQKGLGPQDLYQNGVMNQRYSWYRVGKKIQVPIVMDPKYSYREKNIILGGFGEIQKKTCVDFYLFNHTGALQGYDYVYITKSKSGCWSHVGRIGGGQQELSLSRGCINHRTAVHEMIHALGFTHEHVRSDRDKYVRIYWANIQKGRERNFVKRTKGRDAYGPYDYGSIMHYDRRAFSTNGQDTIMPLKHSHARIGLGRTMSYWDTERILHMYKCGKGYGGGGGGNYGGYGYSEGSNDIDIDGLDYDDHVDHGIQNGVPPPRNDDHHNSNDFHPGGDDFQHHPNSYDNVGYRMRPHEQSQGHRHPERSNLRPQHGPEPEHHFNFNFHPHSEENHHHQSAPPEQHQPQNPPKPQQNFYHPELHFENEFEHNNNPYVLQNPVSLASNSPQNNFNGPNYGNQPGRVTSTVTTIDLGLPKINYVDNFLNYNSNLHEFRF